MVRRKIHAELRVVRPADNQSGIDQSCPIGGERGSLGKNINLGVRFSLVHGVGGWDVEMVDCAIAVCAAKTNKRATSNPEKTVVFLTVITRLSF